MSTTERIQLLRHWMNWAPGSILEVKNVGRGACKTLIQRGVAEWLPDEPEHKAVEAPPRDKSMKRKATRRKAAAHG